MPCLGFVTLKKLARFVNAVLWLFKLKISKVTTTTMYIEYIRMLKTQVFLKLNNPNINNRLTGLNFTLNWLTFMTTETTTQAPLHTHVTTAVEQHLASFNNDQDLSQLYDFFLGEFEKPLLIAILKHTQGNQSKAAQILGLNRGTLRTKLKAYDLLKQK